MTAPGPDERTQVPSRLPPLDAVVEVDADALARRLVSLPDEMNALLRLLDGRRTLREVIAGSGQDEIEATGVLARLHELGVLRVRVVAAGGSAVAKPAATPAPDGVGWFAEPHGPADIPEVGPEVGPEPGGGWVRDMLARLRR